MCSTVSPARSVADEVTLRPWRVDDTPALVAAWHDDDIGGWLDTATRSLGGRRQRWIEGCDVREQRLLAVDRVIDVAGECVGGRTLRHRSAPWCCAHRLVGRRRASGSWVRRRRGRRHARCRSNVRRDDTVAQIGIDNTASVRVAEALASCCSEPVPRSNRTCTSIADPSLEPVVGKSTGERARAPRGV